jgi:type I restriction enzyme, S subunit
MTLDSFFDNFALLTDAPNAVAKLREIVLQLAVRGKLISQDLNDESASVLVERIKIKRAQLAADRVIKKFELLPPISVEDAPFELPKGWTWARFPELGEFGRGKSKHRPRNDPKLYRDGKYPLVQTGDVARSNGIIKTYTGCYNDLGLAQSRMWSKGTLCITIAANIADSGLLDFDACIPDSVVGFVPSNEIKDARYFEYFMRTAKEHLQDYAPSTAQKNINLAILEKVLIPLPPLAEQKRIVEKCDRLLILCDEIEKRQQQRQASLLKMNEGAIAQLLTAQNPDEFQHHWQCICNNFDLLYNIPETIPKLRQAILQLAVQGKLVSQSLTDEPAPTLLEKIKTEREELAQIGQLAKLQQFPPIESDNFPYQLPMNWMWVPLGALLIWGPRNGYSPKPVPEPTKIKSLTLTATTSGQFKGEYFKYVDKETEIASHLWLEDGDILMQRANTIEYVGVAAVYRGSSQQYIYPDLMMKLRCSTFLSIDYIHLAINSEKSRNFLRARATGTSSNMPKINQATVNSLPIPLPPLAEQKRIVDKVDSLLSLCNALEAKLKAARDSSTTLMEIVARQILVV